MAFRTDQNMHKICINVITAFWLMQFLVRATSKCHTVHSHKHFSLSSNTCYCTLIDRRLLVINVVKKIKQSRDLVTCVLIRFLKKRSFKWFQTDWLKKSPNLAKEKLRMARFIRCHYTDTHIFISCSKSIMWWQQNTSINNSHLFNTKNEHENVNF